MDGVTGILIKLGARFVLFGLVFVVAARRSPQVSLPNKWATPLIALVFAALNTALYRVLNLASLGALGFVMPLVANLIFLYATVRVFAARRWLVLEGTMTFLWLAALLTTAHGLLWVGLDYLPPKL